MSVSYNFFLGAGSPSGFRGYFETLGAEGLRLHIIKSGPGCGKSTMMRAIDERLTKADFNSELIHCSSDPDSLDGVLCRDKSFAIIDGTAPHVVEPSIPVAGERVLSMYSFLGEDTLTPQYGALKKLFADNAACHSRASLFLASACSLVSDVERTAGYCICRAKITKYVRGLCARTISRNSSPGKERLRLQSAVTPKGIVNYADENLTNFSRAYIFDDRFGVIGHMILSQIRSLALAFGCDITVCRSPFNFEQIDAVLIPDQSLAFCISTRMLPAYRKNAATVHCRRFYDLDRLDPRKNRLSFELRATNELLDGAAEVLSEAKSIHDDIENIYKNCVDFSSVARMKEVLCSKLEI